jgi:hypothetical protein
MAGVSTQIVRDGFAGLTLLSEQQGTVDPSGATVVMDFLMKALLSGHGFQTRIGALTTPVSADVEVTTVAAEMSSDSIAGMTLIPIRFHFNLEAIVGTLPQASVKLTGTASTAGTAFTPLPLLVGGPAAASFGHTARAAAAGGVTVVDDAVTTTRVIYSITQAAAGNMEGDVNLYGRGVVRGAGNAYVAVGSVSTGSTYFSALDVLAIPTARIGAIG